MKSIITLFAGILAFGILGTHAQSDISRDVLPPPDPTYQSKIEMALKDSKADFPKRLEAPQGAPNVLLIMGDDIGYGHVSTFGGPASTPTLDQLAQQGLKFTNFHTTAICAASRASLLTGRNGHSVGMGVIPEASAGFPGYSSYIPRSAASVLEILRHNGYSTAWIGKTHLTPIREITPSGPFDRWPVGMGAEYSYGFFGPGVSQWYPPIWENTTPVRPPKTPEQGYHLEADSADKTIDWIQKQESIHPDKPWIVYYAPTGHKPPIGVPKHFADKYRGQFDDGYDKLRERILARQKELGIVSANTKLAPRPESVPAWDELSDQDKKVGARWMEVFTGAVEHTDYQIGRIIDSIEQVGDLDNTLIIYIPGDNGPTPEGGLHGINNKMTYGNGVRESLDDLEKVMDGFGLPGSNGSNPAAWGWATSTPYTYGKMVTSGGGVSVSMVVSWPAGIKARGDLRGQFHHLIDVAPTILESAGIPAPTWVNGIKQKPIEGVSMLYAFDDAKAKDRRTTQYFELMGSRAIYHDGWWAGTRHGMDGMSLAPTGIPFEDDVWELYDTRNDFGLATNIAAKHPDKLKSMQALFDREAHKYDVYPMADNGLELMQQHRAGFGNKAVYYPGTFRLPEDAVLDIKNRSFSIEAEIENPNGDAEGVIVTLGGQTGGYALLVNEGKPTFIYNWLDLERYMITSSEHLLKGKNIIRFDFAYDGGGLGKGGTGSLSINGKQVAEGRLAKTIPSLFPFDDTFDVGEDWGTPVSPSYEVPFGFTGILQKVTVEVE